MNDFWSNGFGRHQPVKMLIHEILLGTKVLRKIHAKRLFGRLERFSGSSVAAADKLFHSRFGLLELFTALLAQAHTPFEKLEGVFERQIACLQLAHDLFEFIKRSFEFRYCLLCFRHPLHFNA
jgi:hypothetical protein